MWHTDPTKRQEAGKTPHTVLDKDPFLSCFESWFRYVAQAGHISSSQVSPSVCRYVQVCATLSRAVYISNKLGLALGLSMNCLGEIQALYHVSGGNGNGRQRAVIGWEPRWSSYCIRRLTYANRIFSPTRQSRHHYFHIKIRIWWRRSVILYTWEAQREDCECSVSMGSLIRSCPPN